MPRPLVHLRAAALVGAIATVVSLVARTPGKRDLVSISVHVNRPFGTVQPATTTAFTVNRNLVDAAELGVGIAFGGTLIDADHLLVVLTDKLGMARRLIPLHGLEWPLALLWGSRGRASFLGLPAQLVRGWAIGMVLHLAIDVSANPSRLPDMSLLYRIMTGRNGQQLPRSPGTLWLKEPFWKWM